MITWLKIYSKLMPCFTYQRTFTRYLKTLILLGLEDWTEDLSEYKENADSHHMAGLYILENLSIILGSITKYSFFALITIWQSFIAFKTTCFISTKNFTIFGWK
jgi:hypothetical protein